MTGREVTQYDEQWAADAKKKASKETVAGNVISHRAGLFKVGDLEFPELCAIILGDIYENAYYMSKFDGSNLVPPTCYAFGEDEGEMFPHPSMQVSPFFKLQNHDCMSCPNNQWSSADVGRGKACKNIRRMCIIPAGVYSPKQGSRDLDLDFYIGDDTAANEEHIFQAPAYTIKVPPGSVKNYQKFCQLINDEYNRPPKGIITRIYIEPMERGGHQLLFEPLALLPSDLYPAVSSRTEAAVASLITPYNPPEEGEVVERQSTARNRLAGLGKKR